MPFFSTPKTKRKSLSGNAKLMLTIGLFYLAPFYHSSAQDHFPVPDPERIEAIAKMLPAEPRGFGHPVSDRDFWDDLAASPKAEAVILNAAELMHAEPLPVNKEQWMAYVEGKTERQNYEVPFWQQLRRFNTLVLAEALENEGRFMESIEDLLDRMLSLGTWKKPQSSGMVDKDYWYGKKHFVDLAIAGTAFNIATADYWLQDKLDPKDRKRIREYIKRDAFDPYLKMLTTPGEEYWWMTAGQNWNSVCHAGVVGSSLSITDDRMERATMVAGAEIGMKFFMKGFGEYGYCSEGVGYWSYGFSNFLALNEIVRINTGNEIDWLKGKQAAYVSLFPSRSEILNGIYPSFSDCHGTNPQPSKWLVNFAEERMGLAESGGIAFWREEKLDDIRDLFLLGMLQLTDYPDASLGGALNEPEYYSEIRDFFPEGLLVVRPFNRDPRGMAASIKAGHNAENHNHNDVGTFEVVLAGEKLIVDPGSERYGRNTFGINRYNSEMMNSYGHPVPVVAGTLQSPGLDAKSTIMEKRFSDAKDFIAYDLSSAYDVSTLKELTRTIIYTRGESSELTVVDKVALEQPGTFETALIVDTYNRAIMDRLSCSWEMAGENQWIIRKGDKAILVHVTSPGNNIIMHAEPLEGFRIPEGYNPVRLGFSLEDEVMSAEISMKITPLNGH